MATVKKRGQRKRGYSPNRLPEALSMYFAHGDYSPDHDGAIDVLLMGELELRSLWTLAREQFLASWITRYPGTRPYIWWRFDAPKDDDSYPIARQIVQGSARPLWTVYQALMPTFFKGLPSAWAEVSECARAESEAAYLKRHGLFLEDEEERLKAADYEPVLIKQGDDDNGR